MTTSALARVAAVMGLAVAGLTFNSITPALAEYEIEESRVEKGEKEFEYRGAVHFGLPKSEDDDDDDDDDAAGGGIFDEEAPVRQSHDFEFEYGITERFQLSTTLITNEPVGDGYGLAGVEIEGKYELIEREGNGWGLAAGAGYGFGTRSGEADEIEFGLITEYAAGLLLLTFNGLFEGQVGNNAETDGLGFGYGWRAEYEVVPHWGIGVEMFGEIEDLSHSGPWEEQEHSIGPTIFWKPGDDDDDDDGDEFDLDEDFVPGGPVEMEMSFNVGVQFGLTDETSDSALKFQGKLEF
jgi:hypothetical protein